MGEDFNTHVLIPQEKYDTLVKEYEQEMLSGELSIEEKRLKVAQLRRSFERQQLTSKIDLDAATQCEAEVEKYFSGQEASQKKIEVANTKAKHAWNVFNFSVYIKICDDLLAKLNGDCDKNDEAATEPEASTESGDQAQPE